PTPASVRLRRLNHHRARHHLENRHTGPGDPQPVTHSGGAVLSSTSRSRPRAQLCWACSPSREGRSSRYSTPVATNVVTTIGRRAHWKEVGASGESCRIAPAAAVHNTAVEDPRMFTRPEATPVGLVGSPSRA